MCVVVAVIILIANINMINWFLFNFEEAIFNLNYRSISSYRYNFFESFLWEFFLWEFFVRVLPSPSFLVNATLGLPPS
jgi:hypothetical protein